jgi:hypothetical protein
MDEHLAEGIAVGGDLVAAGVSAIPVIGGPIAGALAMAGNVARDRRIRYLQELVEALGGRVDRLEQAILEPALADLVEHGLEVAPSCRSDDQLSLCSHIVAESLSEGAGSEHAARAHIYLGIVQQLEPTHLEVLTRISQSSPVPAFASDTTSALRGVLGTELSNTFPDLADIIEQVVAWLVALGLVENVGLGRTGGPGPPVQWASTPFGDRLIEYLHPS